MSPILRRSVKMAVEMKPDLFKDETLKSAEICGVSAGRVALFSNEKPICPFDREDLREAWFIGLFQVDPEYHQELKNKSNEESNLGFSFYPNPN